ncbi:hypothetical protein JCGZ_09335 [Jatropha curcas]|uniref:Uncharacterized protein n=1 Tax=Jatropha curcas TaxID=180498 RepID=A0A067KXC8_JATCU|nr:hypothetical protein JCGZ_09335 [Jatropha curcas]
MQVVEDLTDRLDYESETYVEIGASDDEEEEDQIIMGTLEGCNTCGRGGTIPPPSSSGTSRASSSTQPPVPPSLPSVPSSSTPPPGPVESSPASQSPTAPASRQIMRIIKLYLNKDGYTWDAAPQEVRDFYWEEFQKHFVWEEAITAMLKVARSSSACLRRYERVGRRLGRILHSRESVTHLHETDVAKKYGREPTPMEVFSYTHTKDHDGNTFVDRRVLGVNENYSTARERVISSQAGSEAESRIDELALYLEAVGGKKKTKVYGIGSQASQFYCGSGSASDASVASSRPQPVKRKSSQHGAGTSSSDRPTATVRDVSTALHQPLPSSLDLDTTDDTLVTPTNTTTHPTDTPADATMLDRAEDRPRRFDFGPF